MNDNIFISDKSKISDRWAIFEDDGISGWLYITDPNENRPIIDCWIYNRIIAPSEEEIRNYKDSPPPASKEYAGKDAFVNSIKDMKMKFKWSIDGNAVALIIDRIPVGYIIVGIKYGYSRNLSKSGKWGNMFDEEKYQSLF